MTYIVKTIYGLVIFAMIMVSGLFALSFFGVGGMKVKIVMSGSMEPAIKTGSIALIKPGSHPYAIGDIITFGKDTRKDIPTTHRIVEVSTQAGKYVYKTKGDANSDADTNEAPQDTVLGKVFLSVPYLGFVIDMAKKPVGFVLLIVLPALLIIGDEIHSIWVEVKKRRRDKPLLTGGNGDQTT